jgi:hypothetical protein
MADSTIGRSWQFRLLTVCDLWGAVVGSRGGATNGVEARGHEEDPGSDRSPGPVNLPKMGG